MRILVADKFEAWGLEQLRGLSDQLVCDPTLSGETLVRKLAEFEPEVLIVRSTRVTSDAVEAARHLSLIIRAGSGVDTIDIEAASRRGVMVANCPGQNSAAVAELTVGLLVSLDRRIPDNVSELRAGRWKKKEFSASALGLRGRTLGIIGAGRIGAEVAKRALAFDMNVLYYHLGRQLRLVDYPNCRRAELDDLLRESDVVTIHVPGGESTSRLIDARRLSLMKPTALLINTARANVVDESALLAALRAGKLRGAALDVYTREPAANADAFEGAADLPPNLYGTHHIGASTEEAQLAVAAETVRLVREFRATGKASNCVNMQRPQRKSMLVVRMRNKPGALAHVFAVLAEREINAEEMDHVIYDGGLAAVAHIRVDREPDAKALERIGTGHPNVIGVEMMHVD
jgi:D-3-phosphoglycerate dehydrogenase